MEASWLREARSLLLAGAIAGLTTAQAQLSGVTAEATKWDLRDGVTDNGCGEVGGTGCSPDNTVDGLLNDEPDSRWSCSLNMDSTSSTTVGCDITYDLQALYTLDSIVIYFHKSDESNRATSVFDIYISEDDTEYDLSFSGENIIPTALGEGEGYTFPSGSTGQYVRIAGEFTSTTNDWLSISEVEFFVSDSSTSTSSTPAPSAVEKVTAEPTVAETDASPTPAPTALRETSHPTTVFDAACANLTVSGAGSLDGDYTRSGTSDSTTYTSTTATAPATIGAATADATCADSETASCMVQRWGLRPDDNAMFASYLAYDDAIHPALISEVWFRLSPGCEGGSDPCSNFPAVVSIACADGTSATPSPVSSTTSTCTTIQVSGTQDGKLDGFYQDQGALQDGVSVYDGFDVDANDQITGNGNTVEARTIDGACSSSSSSTISSGCSFRQWWVRESAGTTSTSIETSYDYLIYDEADHPVDVTSGSRWYTSATTVLPYSEVVSITCADDALSTSSTESTPTPYFGGESSEATIAPVGDDDDSTAQTRAASDSGTGGGASVAVIAGVVGGGLALILVGSLVVYKVKKSHSVAAAPPPSYDDLVGSA